MVQRIPGAVHHTGPGHILAGVPLSDDVNALFDLPISLKSYLRVIAALLSRRRTCTSINVKNRTRMLMVRQTLGWVVGHVCESSDELGDSWPLYQDVAGLLVPLGIVGRRNEETVRWSAKWT